MLRHLAVLATVLAFGCVETPVYSYPQAEPPPPAPPIVTEAPPPAPATTTIVINGGQPAPVEAAPVVVQPACTAQYYGAHPIPDAYGGGWCTAEGPHCHDYLPVYTDQYQYRDNVYYFGVTVANWSYYGAHPIPPEDGGGWCNIPGPHSHHYRPWADFGYDPGRHVYVYHQGHWGNRPTPVQTSYPQPRPTYSNQPQPTYPTYSSHPQPSYPTPERQPIPYGNDVRTHVVEPSPEPQRQPIPYGHDVHPQVVQPAPYRGPSDVPHVQPGYERPSSAVQPGVVRPAEARPNEAGATGGVYRPNPGAGTRPVSPGYGNPNRNTVGAERPDPMPIPNKVRPGERVARPMAPMAAPAQNRKKNDEKRKVAPRR